MDELPNIRKPLAPSQTTAPACPGARVRAFRAVVRCARAGGESARVDWPRTDEGGSGAPGAVTSERPRPRAASEVEHARGFDATSATLRAAPVADAAGPPARSHGAFESAACRVARSLLVCLRAFDRCRRSTPGRRSLAPTRSRRPSSMRALPPAPAATSSFDSGCSADPGILSPAIGTMSDVQLRRAHAVRAPRAARGARHTSMVNLPCPDSDRAVPSDAELPGSGGGRCPSRHCWTEFGALMEAPARGRPVHQKQKSTRQFCDSLSAPGAAPGAAVGARATPRSCSAELAQGALVSSPPRS
jgi:hypothetical protein